jgi:hypothetical protein
MFFTVPLSQRLNQSESYLLQHLPLEGIDFDYRWIGASPHNNTKLHYLTPPRNLSDEIHNECKGGCHNERNIDLAIKDIFSLNYHAEESNADWMFRTTEDMIINFNQFPLYLSELQRNYNPQKDVVIRSNCLEFSGTLYPQGGTGVLFSKAASIRLARNHHKMIQFWRESEDITLVVFFQQFGLQMIDTDDPHFLGLGWDSIQAFQEKVSRTTQKCPQSVRVSNCRRHFNAFLDEVVFYHTETREKDMINLFKVAERVFKMNRSILWYSGDDWGRPEFCIPNVANSS